jgi:hypothetical protein
MELGQAAAAMKIAIRKSLVGARQVILEEIQRRYNAPAWWVRKAIGEPKFSERKEP